MPLSECSVKLGRRSLPITECSDRSKRRKTETLRSVNDVNMLASATSTSLYIEGNRAASTLIKEVVENSPQRAEKILNSWKEQNKSNQNVSSKYTPSEALSFIISNNFTKHQYEAIYKGAKLHNCNLYPNYKEIVNAKKAAYPCGIEVSEKSCEIPLQSLLQHTTSRLLEALQLPLSSNEEENKFILMCKYGFDGSSGQSTYKQAWSEDNLNDQSLFTTSIAPLQLKNVVNGKILWENPRPSSTRFCRPLRIQWLRESKEVIKKEKQWMDDQISRLEPVSELNSTINFSIKLTMIDSKVNKSFNQSKLKNFSTLILYL